MFFRFTSWYSFSHIIVRIEQLFLLFSMSSSHSYSPSSFIFRALGVVGASHSDMALQPRFSRVSRSNVSSLALGSYTWWSLEQESSSFMLSIFCFSSSNKLGFGGAGKTSLRVTGVTNEKNIPLSSFSRADPVEIEMFPRESSRYTSADVVAFITKTVWSEVWPACAIWLCCVYIYSFLLFN